MRRGHNHNSTRSPHNGTIRAISRVSHVSNRSSRGRHRRRTNRQIRRRHTASQRPRRLSTRRHRKTNNRRLTNRFHKNIRTRTIIRRPRRSSRNQTSSRYRKLPINARRHARFKWPTNRRRPNRRPNMRHGPTPSQHNLNIGIPIASFHRHFNQSHRSTRHQHRRVNRHHHSRRTSRMLTRNTTSTCKVHKRLPSRTVRPNTSLQTNVQFSRHSDSRPNSLLRLHGARALYNRTQDPSPSTTNSTQKLQIRKSHILIRRSSYNITTLLNLNANSTRQLRIRRHRININTTNSHTRTFNLRSNNRHLNILSSHTNMLLMLQHKHLLRHSNLHNRHIRREATLRRQRSNFISHNYVLLNTRSRTTTQPTRRLINNRHSRVNMQRQTKSHLAYSRTSRIHNIRRRRNASFVKSLTRNHRISRTQCHQAAASSRLKLIFTHRITSLIMISILNNLISPMIRHFRPLTQRERLNTIHRIASIKRTRHRSLLPQFRRHTMSHSIHQHPQIQLRINIVYTRRLLNALSTSSLHLISLKTPTMMTTSKMALNMLITRHQSRNDRSHQANRILANSRLRPISNTVRFTRRSPNGFQVFYLRHNRIQAPR